MSNVRLSADLRALPYPVFAWEHVPERDDLVFVGYNAAAERQTNQYVTRLLGRSARDLYADQPHIVAAMLDTLGSGEPRAIEAEYSAARPDARHVIHVTFFRSTDGLVLAVTDDLTERRQTQRALRESELRYRMLVEGAPDGIVVHREGRILYVNDAFAAIVGAPSSESLIGSPVLDHVHPADRAAVVARVKGIEQGGRAPLAAERLLRADGSVVYAEITGIPTTYDGKPATQAIVRDVSDRHKAQALFVALSEQAITGVSVIQDGVMRYVNPRCAELFGYQPPEMIGMSPDALVAPASREFVGRMLRSRVAEGSGSVHFTFTGLRKSGDETEIEVYGSVIELDGRPAIVATLLDAAERERMWQQLRQAQKMEAVGQLAGGIAHDFNNILTAIISYAGMVLAELPPGSSVRSDVREIEEAGRRASLLTKQLLAFSRKQALAARVLDVNEIVEGIGSMLGRLLGSEIDLSIEPGPDVPRVLADRVQLEQVLLNLTVNARDAMQNAGRLRVATGRAVHDAASASAHPGLQPGLYASIRVADSGPGIPANVLSRIFEPFFTTKEAGAGSGLGLAVVYGIVKQSGGYIMVDTAAGTGTTFTVLLPAINEST